MKMCLKSCMTTFLTLYGIRKIELNEKQGKIKEGGTVIVDLLLKFQALKTAWIAQFLGKKSKSILVKHLDHLLKSYNIGFEYK